MAEHVVVSSAEVLKRFAQRITTSSTCERVQILQQVSECVNVSDLPENAFKGIFRYLLLTLGRYRDAKSRQAVVALVKTIVKKHPAVAIKNLNSALSKFAENAKSSTVPSRSSSGDALAALTWTCAVLATVLQENEDVPKEEIKKMISIQCGLLYRSLAVDTEIFSKAAYRKMASVWRQSPSHVNAYREVLLSDEPSIYDISMMGVMISYLSATKNQEVLDKVKEQFLDVYIKQLFGSRTKPPVPVLKSAKPILQHCKHETFKDQLLPVVQRSLLRNAEIILEGVAYMLSHLQLDLSQYAPEFIKSLGGQLTAKNDTTRAEACSAVANLAVQCSDPSAVEKVVVYLFEVFNGSEGKLTLTEQKISVLQAIGNMGKNAVSGTASLQNLSTTVAELFLSLLQNEAHEGTLVHALSMLSIWCSKFYTRVPDKLMQWFKKGITLKTSTSSVRYAYLQCMNTVFRGDTLPQAVDMLQILTQTVEKASNQSTQSQLVAEAVSAANILARLALVDISAESKLQSFWNIVLDSQKQLLTNEKFLSSVSDEVLEGIVILSERLILEYPQKMTDKVSRPYYKAIIFCLTRRSWAMRKFSISCVKKILSLLGGSSISLAFVEEFISVLKEQKLVEPDQEKGDGDKENVSQDQQKFIPPHILAQAIINITAVEKADPKDAESIALATLKPAHHPCIVFHNPGAWTDILFQLKLDARNFIRNNSETCLKSLKTGVLQEQNDFNALETLVRIAPEWVLPSLIEHVKQLFADKNLLLITRDEYGIFLTEDGQLYDKSFVESLGRSAVVTDKNIRRENKLYSYKEQMAEIELKKELEQKKGKPAQDAPKLTKKQEEQVQAQLQKEKDIRDKLRKLDSCLQCGCQLLQSAIKGNPWGMGDHMTELCRLLVPLLKSPLAAPRVKEVFLKLGISSFSDSALGNLVSHATLRLLQPACTLYPGWSEEPQVQQTIRAVNLLYTKTVIPSAEGEIETRALPVPTFSFCFYLLNCVLINCGELVGRDENIMKRALFLIMTHAQIRKEEDSSGRTTDPSLLPCREFLQLLVNVIGVSLTNLQQHAHFALIEVAKCLSGEEGCATASSEEINVLLEALMSSCTGCRESALQALQCMSNVLPNIDDDYKLGLKIAQRVWVASFDPEEDVKKHAKSLLKSLNLEEPCEELCSPLADDVVHPVEVVRKAAADGLAEALKFNDEFVMPTISQLLAKYDEKSVLPPPVLDEFGRVISDVPLDMWEARSGIALALGKISPILPQEQLLPLFHFYIPKGLGDRNAEVRTHMREAALAAINDHGKDNLEAFLPIFDDFLKRAPETATNDAVRQSIIILMGSLAKHLDKEDPKIKPIVANLIGALSTPSQEVQDAVANCLPPLVPAIKADASQLVQKLMQHLLESENYGERRGAAYGLAGLVKGLSITALKQLDIMSTLEEAVKDKKNPRRREGALFAYEMLCIMLGKFFEPYVVSILPHLLLCFGDGSQYVREAADDTSKAVMSMLTAHGVKLVLPSLLKGLEEDSWRTKTGAVELLGAMAFCAPKQLSACLPSIVPKLTEVLTDSHVKVQKAGAQALKQIGSVIRNPEIQAIVPVLLDALQEPAKKTMLCLQMLLETKFVHFIDAPSLALIMPVAERAFQDRNTEIRKMAAQIIGNMYSLTDQKDLEPYIEKVIPGLKQSLLDPVPEVRTVSARALGAMVKGLSKDKFNDLMKWLMDVLKSEASSVDRSGAAQGLSEVFGGLGLAELQKMMPSIIQTAERLDIPSYVRDGYIMLYIYLPSVFGDNFLPYVGPIIPSILKALADESEYVRDTALRAGQRIINMYANTAIELLLPELERGLFDDNWRIRYSSVQLLGDLLFKMSGVSGKMSTESASEDDNFGTENSHKAILSALGMERRNQVLAGMYMGRSDTALLVRQAALHVWKVVVSNTPRTLREILPTLFTLLLGCLASTSHDKRQVAARTLGDLVRKLGERVLPEIIPILESGLDAKESETRQGVCIGLSEIMASTNRDHVIVYAESLIPTVRKALIDPLPEVRKSAATTFDNLHSNIGQRALDEILPYLLAELDVPDMSERALDGLAQVMTVKSRVVLPYLVPQLISHPVNTRALSFLSSVAGDVLTKHLSKILPALLMSLSEKAGSPEEAQELEYCKTVVLSVDDDFGVRTIMEELLTASNTPTPDLCRAAVSILQSFCENTKADYADYLPQIFRGLIALFTRSEPEVLDASWECLSAVTKKIEPTDMFQHIANIRQAVKFALADFKGKELPGFSIPKKGIAPVLPIFREGILNGSLEIKEQAAIGLGEIIHITSAEALKPSVVNITGPLIRILGERFVWNVKTAILETLTLLLAKVGVMLKPFLPQLQTTFIKALNDPNRSVRLKAAAALGELIVIHTRVDPLFTDLQSGIKNAEDTSVRDTMLQAMRFCLSSAGSKMSDAIRKQTTPTLLGMLGTQEDSTRVVASGCLGALCRCLSPEELTDVLIQNLLSYNPSVDWTVRHGRSIALGVALKEAGDLLCTAQYQDSIKEAVAQLTDADRIPLCLSGYRCVGYLLAHQIKNDCLTEELIPILIKGMKHDSNEVKQLVGQLVSYLTHLTEKPLPAPICKLLIPSMVMGTKEKNTAVKANCEFALISLLKLRAGDGTLKAVIPFLDSGMQDVLKEVVSKSLKKLCNQPELPMEQIDETILV
ncbi:hypothetical protein ACJMK2_011991 [Sinanodonta woodiana]|uniref:TOG domain-containing protein n=1 Tax=Sinanodonta woodiana TaxID=1069815 RepID=A0ABD3V746_SINWO